MRLVTAEGTEKTLNMKLAGVGKGLLLNFNEKRLKEGIKRMVL